MHKIHCILIQFANPQPELVRFVPALDPHGTCDIHTNMYVITQRLKGHVKWPRLMIKASCLRIDRLVLQT